MQPQIQQTSIKDMSFSNIFARKFVVRLIVFAIVSILILSSVGPITESIVEQKVNNAILSTSIELAELSDTNMAKDRKLLSANVILSTLQEKLNQTKFVNDASAAFYNMTKGELVARSYEIPIVCEDASLSWWREQANVTDGYPTISMNAEMTDFCKTYSDLKIVADTMYYSNFVLFPTKLSAIDGNGKVVDEVSVNVPIITNAMYDSTAEIKIIGNEENDVLYTMLVDFQFKKPDNAEENNKLVLEYISRDEYKNIDITSKQFVINEDLYNIDVAYQISFWSTMWIWVALIELLGILLCAVSAFINTKETFALYN